MTRVRRFVGVVQQNWIACGGNADRDRIRSEQAASAVERRNPGSRWPSTGKVQQQAALGGARQVGRERAFMVAACIGACYDTLRRDAIECEIHRAPH
jgi:hypothetical protein